VDDLWTHSVFYFGSRRFGNKEFFAFVVCLGYHFFFACWGNLGSAGRNSVLHTPFVVFGLQSIRHNPQSSVFNSQIFNTPSSGFGFQSSVTEMLS
jgi:hypothetical protein